MTDSISAIDARRIALTAQGFAEPRPVHVEDEHLRGVIDRLGLIQLDSVNVAVRAHYMPFFSRLGQYPMELLGDGVHERFDLFEYWGHVASLIPVKQYPLFKHRMEEGIKRRSRTLRSADAKYLDLILEEIRRRGPLTIADLEDPGQRSGSSPSPGWWNRAPGKVALEYHFATGDITSRERRNFSRVYDLPERAIPEQHLNAKPVTREDAHREFVRIAALAFGIGTDKDLADYYRIRTLDARPRLAELVESGELRKVEVEGWSQPAYLHSEASTNGPVKARALLSPFDQLIWERDRTERLFDFFYRIEIYVPEKKRQYGYYVLPFLLGEEIVARVDIKAERDRGTLRVRSAFIEDGQDPGHVAPELAAELELMAEWLGLQRVRVGRRGNLCGALREALR
ncbi:MAG: winged helix DNA-binding domain-containing protein [Chloroflexi bacterium]|nr:winged helix DNA-binding domain-containing protein [Chloroflexota bacterium]